MTDCASNNASEDLIPLDHLKNLVYPDRAARKVLRRRRVRNDRSSYTYLLRTGQFRKLRNFRFTKARVPTGEGFFKGRDRKLIHRPDRLPVPRYFEMEVTTVCNKRCIMCEYVYWKKEDQVRRHLTLDEFKHVVDQFPDVRWVNLTGEGSAFLNPDYPGMIQYLSKKHGTSIWLVDHLCDTPIEKLEKEVLPYIHGIYVSMDAGTKPTYEGIKVGCDYDRVVENLKAIIAYKKANRTPFPHLSFRYILLKQNVQDMPAFVDLINGIATQAEWGGSSTKIEFTGLLYFDEIVQHYVEKIPMSIVNELKTRTGGIEIQFSHASEATNPPIEKCAAWLEPYIMLPGYVMPCCAVMMSNNRPFLRKYAFGNVFEQDMADIWKNDYYTRFRAMVNDPTKPVPKICAGCRAYRTRERIERNGVWDPHEGAQQGCGGGCNEGCHGE